MHATNVVEMQLLKAMTRLHEEGAGVVEGQFAINKPVPIQGTSDSFSTFSSIERQTEEADLLSKSVAQRFESTDGIVSESFSVGQLRGSSVLPDADHKTSAGKVARSIF